MDEKMLDIISKDSGSMQFFLNIDDKRFDLQNVSITESATPVNSPTLRGGVYFSDKVAYKMKASVYDVSIVPRLSRFMLGPNTEYHPLEILASVNDNSESKKISIKAYLTSSMQSSSHVELNLIVADSKYT